MEKLLLTHIHAKKNNQEFKVYFDHADSIYYIYKYIDFNVTPNLKKITNKIINKYGKPTKKGKTKLVYHTGYGKTYCWGNYCKIKYINDDFDKGTEAKGKGKYLSVDYLDKKWRNGGITNFISFTLYNSEIESLNYKWEENQEKLYRKQQKEKASNIDF